MMKRILGGDPGGSAGSAGVVGLNRVRPEVHEAGRSILTSVRALVGPEVGAAVWVLHGSTLLALGDSEPDTTAMLEPERAAALQRRTPRLVVAPGGGARSALLIPLRARGGTVGLLEATGRASALEGRDPVLQAVAVQGALLLAALYTNGSEHRNGDRPADISSLGRSLLGTGDATEALRAAMRFCDRHLDSPAAAWLANGDPTRLRFVGAHGFGTEIRTGLSRKIPTLRRHGLASGLAKTAASRFRTVVGSVPVRVIDAADAVVVAHASPALSKAVADEIGGLMRATLRNLAVVERAQRRNESLDVGIASVAHEVREPLLASVRALERLERKMPRRQELELLLTSRAELERLAELVEGLLHWSVGNGSLQMASVDLVELVSDVITSFRERSTPRISLSAQTALAVSADALHLRVAIANLLRNAVAFSPTDGRVEVLIAARNGEATIAISDDGPGVPETERESIFEALTRGRGALGSKQGKGLGLFIARRVIEEHGGRIWVEEGPTGATFVMTLPA